MKVDIENELIKDTEGVYIVWTGSVMDDSLKVIYIGQGYMYDEIRDLRVNPSILEYSGMEMFIAWAETKPFRFDGIEAWLNVKLKPEVKKNKVPSAMKIKVNLPWDEPGIQQLKEQLKLLKNNDEDSP